MTRSKVLVVVASLASACFGARTSAQMIWEQRSVAAPEPRSTHALAYDAARARVVLFGGGVSGVNYDDTWEWDGSGWSRICGPGCGPVGRQAMALAYDLARGQVVLFGGETHHPGAPSPLHADTWVWDGVQWQDVSPPVSPSPRSSHAMAYDSVRQRVVLFGGSDGSGYMGDTWEWDGAAWVERIPAGPSPSVRGWLAMAFDSARGCTVLYGGVAGGVNLSDTWEWDGNAWTLRCPDCAPGVRQAMSIVYDSARQRTVLFGGWNGSTWLGDTWEWDGQAWTLLLPEGPPPRAWHAGAFDSARGQSVVFGGERFPTEYDDTWVLVNSLTSIGPINGWIGLKSSDDVGIRFDLMGEAYVDGVLVASGTLDSVAGGSSGFNHAHLYSVPLSLDGPHGLGSGDTLTVKLYVRNACAGSGKNSGVARLWYNDAAANTSVDETIGGASGTLYVLPGSVLGTAPGTGPRLTIDVQAGSKCSPYKLIGSWNRSF